MFSYLEATTLAWAHAMPLTVFAAVASFVEEIIAPIPSPTVMITAGSLAKLQGHALEFLLLLAILGAVGKVFGALVLYVVSDKMEDIIMNKFARFFGITHEQIESFGKRLSGGWKDYVVLTLLRSLPMVPSSLLSIGCGVLKIPLPLFITTTFLGTIVRDGFYLYVGFIGMTAIGVFLAEFATIESLIQYGAILIVGLLAVYGVYRTQIRKSK